MDSPTEPTEAMGAPEQSALVRGLKERVAQVEKNVQELLKLVADQGTCRGPTCNAPIWWMATKHGRKMCFDADGAAHWASCPDAKNFKGRR